MALYLQRTSSPEPTTPSDLEKTINGKIAVKDQSMKYLASTLQNCHSHRNKGIYLLQNVALRRRDDQMQCRGPGTEKTH